MKARSVTDIAGAGQPRQIRKLLRFRGSGRCVRSPNSRRSSHRASRHDWHWDAQLCDL